MSTRLRLFVCEGNTPLYLHREPNKEMKNKMKPFFPNELDQYKCLFLALVLLTSG
jgi:hypothetical protein